MLMQELVQWSVVIPQSQLFFLQIVRKRSLNFASLCVYFCTVRLSNWPVSTPLTSKAEIYIPNGKRFEDMFQSSEHWCLFVVLKFTGDP